MNNDKEWVPPEQVETRVSTLTTKPEPTKEYSRYAAAKVTADEKGLVIVAPKANELFVDIDDEPSMDMFQWAIHALLEIEPATYIKAQEPKRGEWAIPHCGDAPA